jgi:hypothetical protein
MPVAVFLVKGFCLPACRLYKRILTVVCNCKGFCSIKQIAPDPASARLLGEPEKFDVEGVPITGRADSTLHISIFVAGENMETFLGFNWFEISYCLIIGRYYSSAEDVHVSLGWIALYVYPHELSLTRR